MTQGVLRSRSGDADHDAWLARTAAAGQGRAFASLYGRHEQRVFNLAFRITGSREHAALATREAFLDALRALPHLAGDGPGFCSCVLTAARNASHDLLEGRLPPLADPPEPEEDPERDPDFEAEQARIRDAGLRLGVPEREALALVELSGLPYHEIAAVMDVGSGSLPELTARARIGLQGELSGRRSDSTALSEECEQAVPLLAMRDDGELDDDADAAWLLDHLAHCGGCRMRLDAMDAARAAYGAWEQVAPPAGLFRNAMAAAAQSSGADWTALIDELEADRSRGRSPRLFAGVLATRRGGQAIGPAVSTAGGAAGEALERVLAGGSKMASNAWRRRPRRNRLVTAGLVLLVLLGVSSIGAGATLVLRGGDPSAPADPSAADAGAPTQARAVPARRPRQQPEADGAVKARETRTTPEDAPVTRSAPASSKKAKPGSEKRQEKRTRPQGGPEAVAVPLPKPKPKPEPEPPASQPAPTEPPAGTAPQLPKPQVICKDGAGKPVPCPG